MQSTDAPYGPELMLLMTGAIDAASREIDGGADEAQRTAMSKRMMVALATGERDPEQLKLAALKAATRQ
jgi:hypothetical protein